jgi:hypothetical protein
MDSIGSDFEILRRLPKFQRMCVIVLILPTTFTIEQTTCVIVLPAQISPIGRHSESYRSFGEIKDNGAEKICNIITSY